MAIASSGIDRGVLLLTGIKQKVSGRTARSPGSQSVMVPPTPQAHRQLYAGALVAAHTSLTSTVRTTTTRLIA
jgi:hypothetical protein